MKNVKKIGLYIGILLFIFTIVLPEPKGMSIQAKYALAITFLMSTWWVTEAISIYATAFIPLALFPIFGILSASEVAENYGHNFVLLLLAGLIIAKALEKHNLHKRIALNIVKVLGTNRKRIILSFMITTALLSMWIANVAVALLMLPIGMAIIHKEEASDEKSHKKFGTALMLSIAYSSSIGGSSNIVGTPANMIFAGVLRKFFPESPEISFLYWFKIGLPMIIVLLPVSWWYLIKYFKIKGNFPGGREIITKEYKALGPITKAEVRVLIIFVFTALGWIFRKDINIDEFTIPGWSNLFRNPEMIHDNSVAMISVLALFCLSSGKGSRLIDWKTASSVPWGVVIIVGGGYALAAAFKATGLSDWIGNELSFIGNLPLFLTILITLLIVIFLTEINSNTATANIFLPILATIAMTTEINPLLLMLPATFACSYSFMLPSGSGTNAIIFASHRVKISEMARCGLWLNLIGVFIITLIFYFILVPIFDIHLDLPLWAK